jgi:methylthioribose-1-phosphate isomerase
VNAAPSTTRSEAIQPIRWQDGVLHLLDQRKLPREETYLACKTVDEVAAAIRDMVVRGAPAIGVTAAFGLAIGARAAKGGDGEAFHREIGRLHDLLAATRPTAVNLFWALTRMKSLSAGLGALPHPERVSRLEREALAIYDEDIAICRGIGRHGAPLVPPSAGILTHCNTGSLATAGYGTALGVVRAAREAGNAVHVYADETRPFLQGARLTAWECVQEKIPVTLICDGAAASLMKRGKIQFGADRVAANGDTANKIGTYSVALAAKAHGIPFYIAAPISTVDLKTPDGDAIPIEQRDSREVTHVGGVHLAPDGISVENPSFDVTPAELIAGIITERGVARAPYRESLTALVAKK